MNTNLNHPIASSFITCLFLVQSFNHHNTLVKHMEGNSLESDGIIAISLRPYHLPDIDDLMAILSDENVTRFSFGEPSLINREKGLNYIKNYMIPHPCFMAICVNNRPIGTISVDQYKGSDKCRALLGYMLASSYWGRGIATKVVKMVVSDVFDGMPELERLEALVDVEKGLAEGAGEGWFSEGRCSEEVYAFERNE